MCETFLLFSLFLLLFYFLPFIDTCIQIQHIYSHSICIYIYKYINVPLTMAAMKTSPAPLQKKTKNIIRKGCTRKGESKACMRFLWNDCTVYVCVCVSFTYALKETFQPVQPINIQLDSYLRIKAEK